MQYACRWAPSLGELEETHEKVWGTKEYHGTLDTARPTVFFGLYGLRDFYALWRHNDEKHILWAGTDIQHFVNGYWLDERGDIRMKPKPLAAWIAANCTSWVENKTEAKALKKLGIKASVAPSFLGDIDAFQVCYKHSDRPKAYASVSGDNFEMYGWDIIERIAPELPWMEFHLYGNTKPWKTEHPNVIVHGRVPKEQMNAEIKDMQIGLRLTAFDGFSEILAKAVLMGQYAIGRVPHPHIPSFKNDLELITKLNALKHMEKPNLKTREWYRKNLNAYPWNRNKTYVEKY